MATDSIPEVSGVQKPVVKDASEKALADATEAAPANAQAYVEKNMQALRAAGLLPELAIDGAKEIEFVQKNFDTIDRSGDGWVTAWEIDQYVKDNAAKLNTEELESLRKVKEKISTLEDNSNDEIGYENDGVTKDDLERAQKRFRAFDFAGKNFERLDADSDGHITAGEIDGYIKDKRELSEGDLNKLKYLKDHVDDIEEESNDEWGDEHHGITRYDMNSAKEADGTERMSAREQACETIKATDDLRPALDFALDNFEKMDADKDGYLDSSEIMDFADANKTNFSTDELAKLVALKRKVGGVEEQSNDEWFDEDNGITKKDIEESRPRIDALAYAKDNFEKLDGDGDGYITGSNIDSYIKARGDLAAAELKTLQYLKDNESDIEEYANDELADENDGMTRSDVGDALRELGSDKARSACNNPPAETSEKPALTNPSDKQTAVADCSAKENIYEVKKGDNLWNICKEHLRKENGKEPSNSDIVSSINEVAKANAIKNPNELEVGQKIKLPVKAEENCNSTEGGKPAEAKTEAKPEEKGADSGLDYMRKRFAYIDSDRDNYITKSEVSKYLKDNEKSLSETEVTALKKLQDRVDDLEEMSNDEFCDENDGITREDINDAERLMKATEYAQKNFDKLDADSDGYVTSGEVTTYIRANSDRLNVQDRASLDYLKGNVSDLEEYSNDEWGDENDGFTKADLKDALNETGSSTVGIDGNTDVLPAPAPFNPKYDATTEQVKLPEFVKESERLFSQLDEDSDGYLSEGELANAVEGDKYTAKDAQIVAALYRNQDDLEERSNDEWGDENDGITRDDLAQFDKDRDKIQSDWLQTARANVFLGKDDNFKKIDTDSDEYLTKSEIKKALERTDLTEDERVSLEFLKDNVDDLEEASNDEWGDENDGITKDDLKEYGDSTVSTVFSALQRTNEAQKIGSRDLYANKENPLESIKPDAIKQGMIGDCYFEAALASLAATRPQDIQRMIKDNGDGTYTVTFPGDTDEPITVTAPTEVEMGLYNQGGKDGTWACVMEKAFGAWCGAHWYRRGPFNLGGGNTIVEGADGGEVRLGHTMSLLTGRDRDTDGFMFSSESEIGEKLNAALNGPNPRPVVAGISKKWSGKTEDGFSSSHVYSVIAFDPNGPEGGTVTVRNPWGGADDTTSGTMKISLKKFEKNFSRASYTD